MENSSAKQSRTETKATRPADRKNRPAGRLTVYTESPGFARGFLYFFKGLFKSLSALFRKRCQPVEKNKVGRCCPQTALRWFAGKVLRHKG